VHYTKLVKERKEILTSPIVLSHDKQNHKGAQEETVLVRHSIFPEKINFSVEMDIIDPTDFKFKFVCVEFDKAPFFRFDSCGAAHRNSNPNIPLSQQQVPTPHFHLFLRDGTEIAYQTNALKDEKQRSALKDISLCVCHFCQESNTVYNKKDYPEIKMVTPDGNIPFEYQAGEDPCENVNFD
jgi:hypothetical protein